MHILQQPDVQPRILPPVVTEQLVKGKEFFGKKYPQMHYLAYFQAYTNTYAELSQLMSLYEEATTVKGVVGIIIGTRPDCMPDQLLAYLKELSRHTFVLIEYGAETASDATLAIINRGHTHADTEDAVMRTADAGIPCGLHLILGLPGEGKPEIMKTIDWVNTLPIQTLKLHQLQLIRGTRLAQQVAERQLTIPQWTAQEYCSLCVEIVARLRNNIAIERFVSQSPADLLIYPKWGLKNYQFTNMLHNALKQSK